MNNVLACSITFTGDACDLKFRKLLGPNRVNKKTFLFEIIDNVLIYKASSSPPENTSGSTWEIKEKRNTSTFSKNNSESDDESRVESADSNVVLPRNLEEISIKKYLFLNLKRR